MLEKGRFCIECGDKIGIANLEGLCRKHQKYSEETMEKFRNAGKKSCQIQKETRRSKNEKLFCEMCESYFQNVKHNEPIFNGWDADVIL